MRIERSPLSVGTNGKGEHITLLGDMQAAFSQCCRRLDATPSLLVLLLVVASGAVASGAGLAVTGHSLGNPWAVAGLAAAGIAAERGRVKLGRGLEVSISLLPALFAAVLFGALASMLVFAVSMFGTKGSPLIGRLFYMATRSITGAVTGVVVELAGAHSSSPVGAIAVGTLAGGIVAEAIDVGFASLVYRIRGRGAILNALRNWTPVLVASVPFYTAVVALLALAYRELSPWTLPLFFVPALAAQRWFVLYQEQRRLADDLEIVNQRLVRANLSFATALVTTLDARDRYTAGHSAAVAIYARDIAARMGLPEERQRLAHLCGLVHDIGKVGLPAGLLEKEGSLTLDERRQMAEHAAIGERILTKVEDYEEIAQVVRHHHERWDGQGYPDGISGEEIPLLSRIITVADAYNAMTSDRPYRDAMPSRVARLRLAQAVESQFDTAVVAAFEAILAGTSESYRVGVRADFTLEAQDHYSEVVTALESGVA